MWQHFVERLASKLDDEDDVTFWEVAIDSITADAMFLCESAASSKDIRFQIGRCSHWLRPHQTRWTADGGFAWPSGYGGFGYSRSGLPEFDWCVTWQLDPTMKQFTLIERDDRKAIIFRIVLPSRTLRHQQAAVHTVWTPGPPTKPRKTLRQLYGFRRRDTGWEQTAHSCTDNSVYDHR